MNTDNIVVNTQSSIKIILDKIIYFDPFKIEEETHDADVIFVTHAHHDHFDPDSINKISNDNTIIVAPKTMEQDLKNNGIKGYILMYPNEEMTINDIGVETIRAYNNNKQFHPKENDWLGYIINHNGITYYVAGDTDKTVDNETVECDIAFLPVGGYYTMDTEEASDLARLINPKVLIPTHYGSIVGTPNDGKKVKENLKDTNIEVVEKL